MAKQIAAVRMNEFWQDHEGQLEAVAEVVLVVGETEYHYVNTQVEPVPVVEMSTVRFMSDEKNLRTIAAAFIKMADRFESMEKPKTPTDGGNG